MLPERRWPPFDLCLVPRLLLALSTCGCRFPVSWPCSVAWRCPCPCRAVPLASIPGELMGTMAVARMMAAVVTPRMSRTIRDLRCAPMTVLPVLLWCNQDNPDALRQYG